MADPAMRPRTPLAFHLPAGRHGCPEGPPGVLLAERAGLAAASVIARAGQVEACAAAMEAGLGLMLPRRPGCTAAGTREAIWTGPGQWLALDAGLAHLARFGFARDLAAALGASASVTDLTGARAVLRLSGPAARDTLAKLLPVDLDEDVFPPGAAALTLAGHVGVTVWRSPVGEGAWNLACQRSFGESLLHAVLDAAGEFGCVTEDVG